MKSNKIVVLGSSNTDMVVKTERMPAPGETVLGGTFFMNPGGKGANQAVAAARLGGDVTFIAKTGDDLFGRQAVEGYWKEGIRTDRMSVDPGYPSGVAHITVDATGENSIVVAPGANATLSPDDVEAAREAIEEAGILLMQLEVPMETVEYAAEMARKAGTKVVLNPAPAAPLSEILLHNCDLLVPNRTEAEMISGIPVTDWESAGKAAEIISGMGVPSVVLTLGADGAFIREGNECHLMPVPEIEAVDTTAAGDTFCGALCVALCEGKSLPEAVNLANRAAALTVSRMGAQSAIPYRHEIEPAPNFQPSL